MLKALKQGLLRTTRSVRLLEAVARSQWRRDRLLILCYHSVTADQEHGWRRALFFTPEELEARLALIRKWDLNVLPLGEAVDRLRNGTLPPRSAALTFDDGTVDFKTIVWPLLKRYGYPATVYVTTYYSEKQLPIFPLMCSYLLWQARGRRLPASAELGVADPVDLSSPSERARVERAIVDRANRDGLSAEDRHQLTFHLAGLLERDYGDLLRRRVLQLMTPEEMRQVAADGADVQLHTHRHRTPRDRALFEREIAENRARIERLTGRPANHFCYPSGVYAPEFLPWLTAQHVATATTCVPALATRTTAPLLLPRLVDTAGMAPIEFEGWLSGFSQVLPRRGAA